MADALRAIAQVAPAFRAALSLHLIETSPRLRALQAARLPDAAWHESLATVPQNRCCCWQTSSSTPCRSGSSCAAARGGWNGSWGQGVCRAGLSRRGLSKRQREKKATTPPPLEGGGRGEGCVPPTNRGAGTPPPNPLPQGEGESLSQFRSLSSANPPAPSSPISPPACIAQPGAALFLDYGPERSTPGELAPGPRQRPARRSAVPARHRRPDRPCGLRSPRRHRGRRRRRGAWPHPARSVPRSPRSVPAHRPPRPRPAAAPCRRPDRSRPAPRRAGPHGPSVQGPGALSPCLSHPARIRRLTRMLPDPLRSPVLPVPHGFFTRLGGVSAGPFASLNCSLSSQDARDAVLREPRPRRPRDRCGPRHPARPDPGARRRGGHRHRPLGRRRKAPAPTPW